MGTTSYRHTRIEPAEDRVMTTPPVPTERRGEPVVAALLPTVPAMRTGRGSGAMPHSRK